MAERTTEDVVREYLAASGVPPTVTDRQTLLDVARWVAEVPRD